MTRESQAHVSVSSTAAQIHLKKAVVMATTMKKEWVINKYNERKKAIARKTEK